jgi:hypothetical protein
MCQFANFAVFLMGHITDWRTAAGINAALRIFTALYIMLVRCRLTILKRMHHTHLLNDHNINTLYKRLAPLSVVPLSFLFHRSISFSLLSFLCYLTLFLPHCREESIFPNISHNSSHKPTNTDYALHWHAFVSFWHFTRSRHHRCSHLLKIHSSVLQEK